MNLAMMILLGFLVVCAIAVSFNKVLLNSILIFMVYSVVMSIVWILLESPDLAITEAAVGAGVTSVLFFLTLRHIRRMELHDREEKAKKILGEESEDIEGENSLPLDNQDEEEWETSEEAYHDEIGHKVKNASGEFVTELSDEELEELNRLKAKEEDGSNTEKNNENYGDSYDENAEYSAEEETIAEELLVEVKDDDTEDNKDE